MLWMSHSCSLCVQLCKAQEEKIRLTSRNWQQELCQRFLHEAPKPNGAGTFRGAIGQGLDDCQLQQSAPGAAGQDRQGYWQVAPGVRLRLLKELCYAVLNTYIFRQACLSYCNTVMLLWCRHSAVVLSSFSSTVILLWYKYSLASYCLLAWCGEDMLALQQDTMLLLVLVVVCHMYEMQITVHACNPCCPHSIVCEL